MSVKLGGVLIGVLMLAILGYALWFQQQQPREIVGTGSIRVESQSRPGAPRQLETRRVRLATREFSEVRMPNGTWIDCGGDCHKAALEAGPDFWDALQRQQGGR